MAVVPSVPLSAGAKALRAVRSGKQKCDEERDDEDIYREDKVSFDLMKKLGPKSFENAGSLTGGGGGGMNGLEPRVAQLEAYTDMKDVRDRLTTVEATMATKGYIDTRIIGIGTLIAAVIAFQEQIQALINHLSP